PVQNHGMEAAPQARGRPTAPRTKEAVGITRLGSQDSLREEALRLRPGGQALGQPLPALPVTGQQLPFPLRQFHPAGILFRATTQGGLNADQVGERFAMVFQEVGVHQPVDLAARAAPQGIEKSNVVFYGSLLTPWHPSFLSLSIVLLLE